jgi:hypothetical protein
MFWVLVQQWVETSENDDKLVFFEDCLKVTMCTCNWQVTMQLQNKLVVYSQSTRSRALFGLVL